MSRIYFHTKNHEDLHIWGGERGWLASLCNDMFVASLDLNRTTMINVEFCERLLDMLYPKNHYLFDVWKNNLGRDPRSLAFFVDSFRTAMVVSMSGARLKIAGREVDTFDVALNTAIAGGSMPIKLAARIHGQCECHAYFEPEAWPWLAETIEEGLARGIFRKWIYGRCKACDAFKPTEEERKAQTAACAECKGTGRGARMDIGWQRLLEFLRREEPELIVMSYSVCEQFPPSCACDQDDEDDYHQPTWEQGVEWLMDQSKSKLLSIKLETVTEPGCVYFGDAVITGWMAHGWEDEGATVG